MSTRLLLRLAALTVLALALCRCSSADAAEAPAAHPAGAGGGGADAHDATAAGAPAAATGGDAAAAREPGLLPTVASIPVAGRTGPGGQPLEVARRTRALPGTHARPFGARTLVIGLRDGAADMTWYPCSSCHDADVPDAAGVPGAEAHPDIADTHPPDAGRGCLVCHAGADVERLALRSGETVSLDEAYRVCAQCHAPVLDAWAAGAHGKRLDGWQGRRVVMGCADCHDPHRPRLAPRVPFRGPTLPPRERRHP